MSNTRVNDRKKKKARKKTWILITILLIGLFALIYFYMQFKSGASLAEQEEKSNTETTEYESFEEVEPELDKINFLLIGSDAREAEGSSLSDSLMIAQYDDETAEIKLVSIMRDTLVNIPGHGSQKINAAFSFGGPELVRRTIKENFDVDVHHYAVVDFSGFSELVDVIAPNGVEVDVESTMTKGIGMTLHPGIQTLNGEELLGYVRFRNDSKSDFGRVERQQEVISKLKDEAIQFQSLTKLPKTLGLVSQLTETNVDSKTIFTIGKGLLNSEKADSEIETMRIPVDGTFENMRIDGVGLALASDLERNKRELKEFLSEDLSIE